MLNLQTKFEVSKCTRYETMNAGANAENGVVRGGQGAPTVMGNAGVTILLTRTTSYSTLIETMQLSCVAFEI